MGNVIVVEATEHMYYSICLADICKELIAEALAFGSAFDKTGDVDDFDRSRHNRARVAHLDKLGEAVVGHGDDTHIGLDGAEGEVGRLGLGIGETIKKCRLADVWQSDYSTLQ